MTDSAQNKRICSIDYGKRRVGLAISDILHITCRPFKTIENDVKLIDKLKIIANDERIGLWVVGVPIGSEGETSIVKTVREFITALNESTGIDTIEIDESFSSKKASSNMIEAGVKKKKRQEKGMLDMFAAQAILREYLDRL